MIKWRFNMIRHHFCPPCAIGGGGGCNKDFKTQLKFPKLVAVRHETWHPAHNHWITVFHLNLRPICVKINASFISRHSFHYSGESVAKIFGAWNTADKGSPHFCGLQISLTTFLMQHLTRALFYFPAMGSRCETKAKRTSSPAFPSQLLLLLSSFDPIWRWTILTRYFQTFLNHDHDKPGVAPIIEIPIRKAKDIKRANLICF